MFTGLIEDVGELAGRLPLGNASKLTVHTNLPASEIQIGDSIAVNGACLTVESVADGVVRFHTLNETLNRTNLGGVPIGGKVNLERALRVGDRLGGHMVSGHIDTTAPVRRVGKDGEDIVFTVALPASLQLLVIPKGSIAINGVSLTIAVLTEDSVSVRIIPHTWQATNLPFLSPGSLVNLEADLVGKYVLRGRELSGGSSVDMDALRRAGF
jgi:riboflavin synthase